MRVCRMTATDTYQLLDVTVESQSWYYGDHAAPFVFSASVINQGPDIGAKPPETEPNIAFKVRYSLLPFSLTAWTVNNCTFSIVQVSI